MSAVVRVAVLLLSGAGCAADQQGAPEPSACEAVPRAMRFGEFPVVDTEAAWLGDDLSDWGIRDARTVEERGGITLAFTFEARSREAPEGLEAISHAVVVAPYIVSQPAEELVEVSINSLSAVLEEGPPGATSLAVEASVSGPCGGDWLSVSASWVEVFEDDVGELFFVWHAPTRGSTTVLDDGRVQGRFDTFGPIAAADAGLLADGIGGDGQVRWFDYAGWIFAATR